MSKEQNTTGENVTIVILGFIGVLYRSFALMVSWAWLVAERVGVRRMTYVEALFATIVIGWLTVSSNLKAPRDEPSSIHVAIGFYLVVPTLTLIASAIAKAVL